MVSKAKSTKGSSQAIDYILNDKGRAIELDRYAISEFTGTKILAEMREFQALKPNCLNNTYSIVLSPAEGRNYTNDELREYGLQHLKNLGLDKHQYLMTAHRSTKHPHIHIIANRIGLQGDTHNDSFIGKKAQASAEKIAISYGMQTAKEVAQEKAYENLASKEKIQAKHRYILSIYGSIRFSSYIQAMKREGIEVQESINKKGELQGFRFVDRSTGKSFKSSEIGKEYGLNGLARNGVTIDKKMTAAVEKGVSKAYAERKIQEQKVKERQQEFLRAEEKKKNIEIEEEPRKRRGLRR